MALQPCYPLRFAPLLRRAIWGGRRLETYLHKTLGEGDDFAESWEVVDHGPDQSVVRGGAFAGQTLHELVIQCSESLFGSSMVHGRETLERFPLLFKFLDCNQTLSVQVHPNDRQAALLDPPDLGKTEAWVVLAADADSVLYAGLKSGVSRTDLEQAISQGMCAECLHVVKVRPGDCVFVPAGTVHALGSGLLIAEIQQSSDTTYRLFDWNRVDKEGRPRPLHVTESLGVIDFSRGPVAPQTPQPTTTPNRELLVRCDKFVMHRHILEGPQSLGGNDGMHLLAVLDGAIVLEGDPLETPLGRGETVLLPAAAGALVAHPQTSATVLDVTLA